MPVTRDQAHALAPLIAACCPTGKRWDPPGILAALHQVSDRSLPEVIRAFTRGAEDRSCLTPAAVVKGAHHWAERSPHALTPRNVRPTEACGICGKADAPNHGNDHAWQRNDSRREANTSTEVSHLRALIRGGDRDE